MKIIPRLTGTFIGREKELQRLKEFFPHHYLFLIKGIGGIGKTTLALALIEELKRQGLEKKIFWIECMEGWRLEDFFLELDSWLKKSGEQGFGSWLEEPKKDLKDKILFLINILNERKFIIFIDDFHLVQDENIKVFLNILNTYLNSRIVFISREDIPASHFEKLDIFEEKLEGLPVDVAANLLKNLLDLHKLSPQPDIKKLAKVAEKVAGHPLLLKLVASLIIAKSLDLEKILSEGAPGEVEDYLFSNILKKVSSEERKVLDILALSNIPIAEDAVKAILKIKNIKEITASLQSKFLLDRDSSGSVFVHQLIAQYLAKNVDDAFKKSLHQKLGEYFEKMGLPQEAFSQFLEGKELLRASQILAGSASKMFSRGLYELLIEDSDRLEKVMSDMNPYILIEKARALSILGRWKESLIILQKVETITTDRTILAELFASIAGVYYNTGNLGKALDFYEKSLKLPGSSSAPDVAIRCLNHMALICGSRGEISRGRKYLQRSLKISSRVNKKGKPHTLMVKGAIHNTAGEFEEALGVCKEAFKLASEMSSARLVCAVRRIMGDAYFNLGKLDEAKSVFEENLRYARKAGDTLVRGSNLLHLGRIAGEKGEYREATEAFVAASQDLIGQGNLLGDAIAHCYIAFNLIDEGRREQAIDILEKSLVTAREFSHYYLEAEILLKISEVYLDEGDIDKAANLSSRVLPLVEKLELPELKADAYMNLAEISLRKHNEQKAEKYVEYCFNLIGINKHPEKFHRAYSILSIISSDEETQKKYAEDAQKLLENLSGSKKRNAERFLRRLKNTALKRFRIYLKDKKYIADKKKVDHMRINKDSYEFFMDIPEKHLFVKGLGEVDIFRKKTLYTLLHLLVLNAGKGFTSEDLFTSVWEYRFEGEASAAEVRTNISRLRTIIEPDRNNPRFIKHSEGLIKKKGTYYFEKNIRYCLITESPFPLSVA